MSKYEIIEGTLGVVIGAHRLEAMSLSEMETAFPGKGETMHRMMSVAFDGRISACRYPTLARVASEKFPNVPTFGWKDMRPT